MFITRTPLRISYWWRRHGSAFLLPGVWRISSYPQPLISMLYVSANRCFSPGYLLKYSEMEAVQTRAEIRHRLIREALTVYDIPSPSRL